MFGLGVVELGIIALILLLLFGAKRIPLLMGSIGEGIKELKHSFKDDTDVPERDERDEEKRMR
ncbi:MAG TPA: twin-arginine translocase TatA/TatE family subunit [Gemmatimonadaceae bacterium]|nr:twin-arginine translocase TatA/TatE family subunit [Gemmatimonadaceae bacterium]